MRTALACNISPLFIRIALGLTFLWAGASKVFYVDDFSGGPAAGLANAGVQSAIDAAQPVQAPPIVPAPVPVPAPTPVPEVRPPADEARPIEGDDEEMPAEPNATGWHHDTGHAIVPAMFFVQDADGDAAPSNASPAPPAPPAPLYTAEQFPADKPVKLRRLNGLILAMDGAHQRGQWPDFLATPNAYGAMAWAAALTELFAGVFLLVGFLSRLAGLGVAGVMAGAMWMTQIGPNLGASDAFLGFLPALQLDQAGAWIAAWKDLLWQFALLMMGLAIFFSGPGRLAIDALLFSSGRDTRRDADDE